MEHRSEEERKKVEKKVDTLSTKLNALTKDLSEERALNKSLQVDVFKLSMSCFVS